MKHIKKAATAAWVFLVWATADKPDGTRHEGLLYSAITAAATAIIVTLLLTR